MTPDEFTPLKADSQLCLRVAEALAIRDGLAPLSNWDDPDDPLNTAGAPQGQKFIDLVATCADGCMLALEHTTIESYEQQLHEHRQIEKLLTPLTGQLAGELPHDRSYNLLIGIGAVADESLEPDDVHRRVGEWVRHVAPDLLPGSAATAPNHFVEGGPPDLPFPIKLYAWPPKTSPGGGSLSIGVGISESDAEQAEARRTRFERALRAKLPKLLEHASARTVLVLEDRDISMSNAWVAREAAREASVGLALSDVIVLVEPLGAASAVVLYEDRNWTEDLSARRLTLSSSPRLPTRQAGP
ncbi:hypothetical protein [Ilumatobacter nonamiensis]|uniref:hypothetical protein n=1 Tax=Ilumatobacter nonamiensis TaxID=467093 RepID=UPI0005917D33|nr:hypothetical protein [Ilumatobacter nonamiensis]